MRDASGDFVNERALVLLAGAAKRLGCGIDLCRLALNRRTAGGNKRVPTDEYRAVLRQIFFDPSETLGIDLARALALEASGLCGVLLRSSPTYGDLLCRAARYIRVF